MMTLSVLPTPSLPLARSLNHISLEDVHSLSAFDLFQHQLDSASVEAAVDAMKRLGVVATAMGDKECLQKLIPYLTQQVTGVPMLVKGGSAAPQAPPHHGAASGFLQNPPYADEVLLLLGQELMTVLQVLGKKHYPECLALLERLATVEETVVREQAVTVLQTMAPDMMTNPSHTANTSSVGGIVVSTSTGGSSSQASLLIALVKRLCAADWFTAKVSACGILPFLFSAQANYQSQNQDLLQLYRELCHDDTPMVRRAAAKHLGKVVQAAAVIVAATGATSTSPTAASGGSTAASVTTGNYVLDNFLLQTLPNLMGDEQDNVRLLAAACTADAPILATHPQFAAAHIVPLVKQASTDMSWRVRNNLAKNFSSVAGSLGISAASQAAAASSSSSKSPSSSQQQQPFLFAAEQSLIMACFVSLLTDVEAEVRASATSHLARMIAWGGPRQELFSVHIQPLLPVLAEDVVMEVRSKTALAIMEAAAASSPTSTTTGDAANAEHTSTSTAGAALDDAVIIQVFGPLLESFLGDEFHEVQLQVLTNLHKIAHLLPGLGQVVTTLLHMVKATNWRVREAVAKLLPHLATARGVDFFSSVLLEPAWLTLLMDPVAQVRYAICSGMRLLVQVAGPEWILTTLLPHHVRIYNSAAGSSYLVRMTLLKAHIEMAVAATGDNALWCDAVLHLLRGLQDKVANVRMVSARGLGRVVHAAQTNTSIEGSSTLVLSPQMQSMIASQIRPALEKMREDEDWDCRQACILALDLINGSTTISSSGSLGAGGGGSPSGSVPTV